MSSRIIRREHLLGWRGWLRRGALLGLVIPLTGLAVGLLLDAIGHSRTSDVAGLALLFLILLGAMRSDCRLASSWKIAVVFGVYVGILTFAIFTFFVGGHVSWRGRPIPTSTLGLLWTSAVSAAYAVCWCLVQSYDGPIELQDGNLCPACGYCLIGNTSQICPECGRPFSISELRASDDLSTGSKNLGRK